MESIAATVGKKCENQCPCPLENSDQAGRNRPMSKHAVFFVGSPLDMYYANKEKNMRCRPISNSEGATFFRNHLFLSTLGPLSLYGVTDFFLSQNLGVFIFWDRNRSDISE